MGGSGGRSVVHVGVHRADERLLEGRASRGRGGWVALGGGSGPAEQGGVHERTVG